MHDIITFVLDNWTLLLLVVLSVVESFFIIILKRKPTYYGYYMDICEGIKLAESLIGSGHGEEKLQFVIKHVCSKHDMDPKFWGSTIASQVEKVLSLPRKKGGF